MKQFLEKTSDKGWKQSAYASDNMAVYYLTSARMKDLYFEYRERYNRYPCSKWFHRHSNFSEVNH